MTEIHTPETDLLFQHFATLATGPDGITRLRELILQLAVQGKLGTQDESDEPASLLLERIRKEKERLVKEGKIKASKSLPLVKEGEVLYSIPKGWKIVQLGDVVNYNGRIKTNPEDIPKDAWLLELEDIEKDTSRIVQRLSVGERDPQSTKSSFKTGDVLYGKLRPYLNKVVVAEEDGYCTTEIAPISIYCDILSEYLAYILKSPCFIEYVNSKSYGMKMPRLGTKDAIQAKIPLPPLAEQQRIVEKLDRLMALCDELERQQQQERSTCLRLGTASFAGLQNAESPEEFERQWAQICDTFELMLDCPENVAVLRQTILHLAVQGKLGTQDEGDEPASLVIKKIISERQSWINKENVKIKSISKITKIQRKVMDIDLLTFQIPKSWEICYFEDIAANKKNAIKAGPFGSSLTKSCYIDNGFKIYGQEQVINNDPFIGNYYISEEKYQELKSCAVAPGDILISLVGTIGKILILPEDCQPGIINPRLIKLSLNPLIYLPYIDLYLKTPLVKGILAEESHGGTMDILNLKILKNLPIIFPPLAEQHRIVEKVDRLMALCDQLEAQLKERSGVQERFAKAVVEGIAP